MKRMGTLSLSLALFLVMFGYVIPFVHAHEAYVLPEGVFWNQLAKPYTMYQIHALDNPNNVSIFIKITIGVLAALVLACLFERSRMGMRVRQGIERFAPYGPLILRFTIAASFFAAAYTANFLGPEIPLAELPYGNILRMLLFGISIMIFFGFFTELAALLTIPLFLAAYMLHGGYIFTYSQYIGEAIVLLLFGLRKWSIDAKLFGPRKRFASLQKYEPAIIRVFYGLSFIYAAITVKLLHPDLTMQVAQTYNLMQFHMLFPSDPLLITFGAGLAEFAIGLFLIVGFQMRLTLLISLFYMTLSLLFFQEAVWPHWMLYGTSLALLLQKEPLSLDQFLFHRKPKK